MAWTNWIQMVILVAAAGCSGCEAMLSDRQQLAISLTPKFTSMMSIFGSLFVVYTVASSKKKRGRVYHRLLFSMGVLDIITSFWFFAGTWPIPRGTVGVADAFGNTATCTVQGFFIQLGLVVPFYNAMLSVNYLLVIRYGWNNAKMKTVEPYLHVGAFIWPTITAIAGVPLKLYNNANIWCWIAPPPVKCSDNSTCDRDRQVLDYQWAFFYIELWLLMIFCSVAMALVIEKVKMQENRVARFATNTFSAREHLKSKRVTNQAFLYVGVFYLTWLFGTINRAYQSITGTTTFPLIFLHSLFVPWQGFLNFLVYNRPYWLRYRAAHPEEDSWFTFIIFFCCCCICRSQTKPNLDTGRTSVHNLGAETFLRMINSSSSRASSSSNHGGNQGRQQRLGRHRTTANTEALDDQEMDMDLNLDSEDLGENGAGDGSDFIRATSGFAEVELESKEQTTSSLDLTS